MKNNEILMPALSPTMEEGTLAKWLVKVGDKINSGDLIAEIETDKATMEIEAVEDGYISKLIVEEGAQGIKINTPIAEFSDTEKFSEISDDESNKNVIDISNKEVIEVEKSSVIETLDNVLAAEFIIWSIACIEKLNVMNSTIGFKLPNAAPTPIPVKPCSVIGVSITLLSPNFSKRP